MKPGTLVIYADPDHGIFRAKITEIDIRVEDPTVVTRWGYPYGKTATRGTVRIKFDTQEIIENLANLVVHGPAKLAKLRRAWNNWQAAKATATAYEEAYNQLLQEYREL